MEKTIEKWEVIEGFKDYEVSSEGRVRRKNRVLKPDISGKGAKVTLYRAEVSGHIVKKNYNVCKLVAKAFLGNPEGEKTVVIHLNGDVCDNRVNNLLYGSRKNLMMSRKKTNNCGENSGQAKVTVMDIEKMRELHACGYTVKDLKTMFPLEKSEIYRILLHERWENLKMCKKEELAC